MRENLTMLTMRYLKTEIYSLINQKNVQDCLSMSGQDGYNWMDLQCQTRYNSYIQSYECETMMILLTETTWEHLTTLSVKIGKDKQ